MAKFIPFIAAECRPWPSKERMGQILGDAGLRVEVRRYKVCVDEDSHISFEQYGGDLGNPSVEAVAEAAPAVLRDLERISAALTRAHVTHRFTVYDENESVIAFFHHDLPRNESL